MTLSNQDTCSQLRYCIRDVKMTERIGICLLMPCSRTSKPPKFITLMVNGALFNYLIGYMVLSQLLLGLLMLNLCKWSPLSKEAQMPSAGEEHNRNKFVQETHSEEKWYKTNAAPDTLPLTPRNKNKKLQWLRQRNSPTYICTSFSSLKKKLCCIFIFIYTSVLICAQILPSINRNCVFGKKPKKTTKNHTAWKYHSRENSIKFMWFFYSF